MCFKRMVQYMKEQFWSICSKAFGLRLRLQWKADASSMDSCWDKMPPELLTEVLMRIEASEFSWPSRRNVVSCAGVCRSWRKNMKEILKSRQLSGKLTLPISLKQPGSVGFPTRCLIARDLDNQTFGLYLDPIEAPGEKFLLAAKKVSCATCTEYIISLNHDDFSQWSSTYIGKLRSNFLGTKFRVYDAHPAKPSMLERMKRLVRVDSYPVSNISYEINALGNRGPRQMRCDINTIPANSYSLPPLIKLRDVKLVLKNKLFRWRTRVMRYMTTTWQLRLWWRFLKFIGRAIFASVKNFQLVVCLENECGEKEHENIILQFEKVREELFAMEYQYPRSAFQAFTICLSSFDTKVACE